MMTMISIHAVHKLHTCGRLSMAGQYAEVLLTCEIDGRVLALSPFLETKSYSNFVHSVNYLNASFAHYIYFRT